MLSGAGLRVDVEELDLETDSGVSGKDCVLIATPSSLRGSPSPRLVADLAADAEAQGGLQLRLQSPRGDDLAVGIVDAASITSDAAQQWIPLADPQSAAKNIGRVRVSVSAQRTPGRVLRGTRSDSPHRRRASGDASAGLAGEPDANDENAAVYDWLSVHCGLLWQRRFFVLFPRGRMYMLRHSRACADVLADEDALQRDRVPLGPDCTLERLHDAHQFRFNIARRRHPPLRLAASTRDMRSKWLCALSEFCGVRFEASGDAAAMQLSSARRQLWPSALPLQQQQQQHELEHLDTTRGRAAIERARSESWFPATDAAEDVSRLYDDDDDDGAADRSAAPRSAMHRELERAVTQLNADKVLFCLEQLARMPVLASSPASATPPRLPTPPARAQSFSGVRGAFLGSRARNEHPDGGGDDDDDEALLFAIRGTRASPRGQGPPDAWGEPRAPLRERAASVITDAFAETHRDMRPSRPDDGIAALLQLLFDDAHNPRLNLDENGARRCAVAAALLRACPHAAVRALDMIHVACEDGDLPLHAELRRECPSPALLQIIVDHSPAALFHCNSVSGDYPIHVACRRANPQLTALLLRVDPICATMRNSRTLEFPIHAALALFGEEASEEAALAEEDNVLRVMSALHRGHLKWLKAVSTPAMVSAETAPLPTPGPAACCDARGQSVAHLAVAKHSSRVLGLALVMAEHDAKLYHHASRGALEALRKEDTQRQTPLHAACARVATSEHPLVAADVLRAVASWGGVHDTRDARGCAALELLREGEQREAMEALLRPAARRFHWPFC